MLLFSKYLFPIGILLVVYACSKNTQTNNVEVNHPRNIHSSLLDTNKLNSLLECASVNRYKDLELAGSCIDSAISLSNQSNFKEGLVKAYKLKGNIISKSGLYNEAIGFYHKSLDIANEIDYREGIRNAKLSLGNAYDGMGETNKSIEYLEELLLDIDESEVSFRIPILVNLSNSYSKSGNLKKAQSYLIEAEKLTLKNKETLKNKVTIFLMAIYSGLGNLFNNIEDSKSAIKYFRKGLEITPHSDNRRFSIYNNLAAAFVDENKLTGNGLDSAKYYYSKVLESERAKMISKAYAYTGICDVYTENKEYNNAIEYAEKGLNFIENTELKELKSMLSGFLGESYLKKKQYNKAIPYIKKAIQGLKETNTVMQAVQGTENLIEAKLGATKNSLLKDFQSYLTLKDSVYRKGVSDEIQNLETKYETEKKEQQITILSQEKEIETAKANRNLWMFLTALLGSIAAAAFFFREKKRKNEAIEAQEREERLKQTIIKLRAGDNHRTDNAFDRTLIELERQAESMPSNTTKVAINKARSLIHTSKVIHNILRKHDEEGEGNVPVSGALKELCASLELMFRDKNIQVNPNCDESITISQRALQPLLLIVEELFTNAWKHAFDNQTAPKIDLTLTDIGNDFIRLTYKDNGKGIPQSIDFDKKDSEGLELIRHFSNSIGGNISMDGSDGLAFKIDFDKNKISV